MNLNKLKYLLSIGIKGNMIVFDCDSPESFSKRLVNLISLNFTNHFNNKIEFIFIDENDLRSFAEKECCKWYSNITLKDLDDIKIMGIAAQGFSSSDHDELLMFIRDVGASLAPGDSKLVIAVDKDENVLLGSY